MAVAVLAPSWPFPPWSRTTNAWWTVATLLAAVWAAVLILPALVLTVAFAPVGLLLLAAAVVPLGSLVALRTVPAPKHARTRSDRRRDTGGEERRTSWV